MPILLPTIRTSQIPGNYGRRSDGSALSPEGCRSGRRLAAGPSKKDIGVLVSAGVDFIAIDGFGGGTGATNGYVRDNVGYSPCVCPAPGCPGARPSRG